MFTYRAPLPSQGSQPGSITDKLFFILEAATTLLVTANYLSGKVSSQTSTVTISRTEVERTIKHLREAVIMIDSLLAIIEERESIKLDSFGNPVVGQHISPRLRRTSRRKRP